MLDLFPDPFYKSCCGSSGISQAGARHAMSLLSLFAKVEHRI
ncbi:MAG: hypothetical protein ACTFAK_10290 [Candidatus Electronema sp. VV]